jgi:hypothetical protein
MMPPDNVSSSSSPQDSTTAKLQAIYETGVELRKFILMESVRVIGKAPNPIDEMRHRKSCSFLKLVQDYCRDEFKEISGSFDIDGIEKTILELNRRYS